MSTPFTLEAKLLLPPDVGLPPDPIALSVATQFDSEADFVLKLTDTEAGTFQLPLGTSGAPGLKGLFIKVDPGVGAQPVVVRFNNSSTGGLEIAPGGGFAYASPNPATGITRIDIDFATAVTVRVWALG